LRDEAEDRHFGPGLEVVQARMALRVGRKPSHADRVASSVDGEAHRAIAQPPDIRDGAPDVVRPLW